MKLSNMWGGKSTKIEGEIQISEMSVKTEISSVKWSSERRIILADGEEFDVSMKNKAVLN